MFSQIRQDSFNVYGCFVGILFGSRRDLKIKYISFWWPGAKLEGDEAPGLGQQELVRLVPRSRSHWPVLSSTCSPAQGPTRHLIPAALLSSSGLLVHHGKLETQHKCFAKLKSGVSSSHLAENMEGSHGASFHILNFLFACVVGQSTDFLSKLLCLEVAEFIQYGRWLFHWFLTQMKRWKERQS